MRMCGASISAPISDWTSRMGDRLNKHSESIDILE